MGDDKLKSEGQELWRVSFNRHYLSILANSVAIRVIHWEIKFLSILSTHGFLSGRFTLPFLVIFLVIYTKFIPAVYY